MISGITSTNENCLRVALQTLPESFRDSPTRLDPSILRDWLNCIYFRMKSKELKEGKVIVSNQQKSFVIARNNFLCPKHPKRDDVEYC